MSQLQGSSYKKFSTCCRKIVFLIFSLLIVTTADAAFLVQEHCDDNEAFNVSSKEACEELCPNREITYTGGSQYEFYSCAKKGTNQESTQVENKNFGEDQDSLCFFYSKDENEEKRLILGCLKKSIEKQLDNIYIGYIGKDSKAKELCQKSEGYTVKCGLSGECYCIKGMKKCPENFPLMGYELDCYPCNTKYNIMMEPYIYHTGEGIDNVCPNDRIIRGNLSIKLKKDVTYVPK